MNSEDAKALVLMLEALRLEIKVLGVRLIAQEGYDSDRDGSGGVEDTGDWLAGQALRQIGATDAQLDH